MIAGLCIRRHGGMKQKQKQTPQDHECSFEHRHATATIMAVVVRCSQRRLYLRLTLRMERETGSLGVTIPLIMYRRRRRLPP